MSDEITSQSPQEVLETPPAEPVYEPAPRRKKPILLGLVFVVLIVIIGGVIILYLRGDIRLPGAPTPLPKVMEKVENGKAKCAEVLDKEKCLRELILDEAVAGRQAAACEKIQNTDLRDGCYDAIARELQEEKVCVNITRLAAREDCAGAILFAKGKTSSDTAICATIISLKWQDSCFAHIFIEKNSLEYCASVGDRREQCIIIVASREAINVGNPSLCAPIEDETARIACEENVSSDLGNRDSDNDGLIDTMEAELGTDPKNPDTDGDGFKDGDEVKAGYNPKGPGKL